MRSVRPWAHSYPVSRLYNDRKALLEGVQRASCNRLASSNKSYVMSTSCVCCCRRRGFPSTSTLARVQQPHWHYYNRQRQFSTLTPNSLLMSSGRGGFLSPAGNSISRVSFGISSSSSRALGTANIHLNTLNSLDYTWKNEYRSTFIRCFANDTNDNEASSMTSANQDDTDMDKISNESITKVIPKEVDVIVEEMESSKSTASAIDKQLFTRSKKTQEDFADYLGEGGEATLDQHTGFIVKRQNFAQNELNKRAKEASSTSSILERGGTSSQTSVQSAAASISTDSKSNDNIPDSESPNTEESAIDPSPPLPYSMYNFSPTDATLSDPQRHLDRRRAIEQKLQESQTESRAATMKNVQRALSGNFIIAVAKLAAAMSSGSSSMYSEFVHSVVDCGNQALLLVGLRSSQNAPDRSHPYGYGKAIYFWALVSALGTFFLGAGVSMSHAVGELMNPTMSAEVPNEVWGVLIMSFAVDGYVFSKTVQGMRASMRIDGSGKDMSFWKYATTRVRDPATLAVLLEDGAACLGVVLAIGGIGLTQYSQNPAFDGMAGVCISGLLGVMGVALATVNHRFLIGQGIDKATREGIEKIILSRRSIDNVYSVQSQWTGPDTFSYKAEVDFDGTFLAAKLLPRYQKEFFDASSTLDRDLRVLLSWYAEDVMRTVEREVRHIEEEIRMKYPAAQYIELEPMSKDADRYAIDDGVEAQLRRVEIDVLNQYLKSLYKVKEGKYNTGSMSPLQPEKKGK